MTEPRPLEPIPPTGDARTDGLRKLLAIVDRLRAPDGCPWDREQTIESLAPSLVEEAFEMLEAIERRDDAGATEEAGDLLMVVALLCRIASETGRFDLARSAEAVSAKLVRRHPHVFGDAEAGSSAHAIANWERIKEAERRSEGSDASVLAGVPVALSALQRAHRLGEKAIAAGFRWSDAAGALAKVREELGELEAAVAAGEARDRVQHELGDLLLAGALLGNYVGIDPEGAARAAARRFERRFRAMEEALERPVRESSLAEMMGAWERAKSEDPGAAPTRGRRAP